MATTLAYNTINPLLFSVLTDIMSENLFDNFILAGGTAISLRLGHRISTDIDLFTAAEYGKVDFNKIETLFRDKYPYIHRPDIGNIAGLGRSFYLGAFEQESVKVDLFYTDTFIRPHCLIENIRLASLDDIVAMKVDIIQRKGRKKDFWDLHELLDRYSIERMIELHNERYPYSHSEKIIIENFTDFDRADDDFDPVCFRGKFGESIKDDFCDEISKFMRV
jgi:predicted nucleotidyltransferase component of viral defense system